MAGVAALAFMVVLEIAARRYGEPGPLTDQAREAIFAPASGPLLYAGLALTTVVLTWRQRFVAAGAAVGIDVAFTLVRWAAGARVTEGHAFGNGALWAILGCAVVALTRRTGADRVLLLKGVGLGLLLVAGRKTGDAWLLITSKTRPAVLDQYVATADHALGSPSWVMGRLVEATAPVGPHVLDWVYAQLAVAAAVAALYQLRDVAAERRFPRHHLVRTFLLIGLLGPAVYMIYPVVGPVFLYGTGAFGTGGAEWAVADIWPDVLPPLGPPHPVTYDGVTPRNCMPSLHTAWAVAIFIHTRRSPRFLRYAGTFWLVATLTATLGFGYHYGIDLVAGVVFAVTIEAALRSYDRGWDRSGIRLVAHGVVVFAAVLAASRYLSLEMARHPWLSGPLLLLAMASVIHGYVRTTRRWEPRTAAVPRQAEAQLEPALSPPAQRAAPAKSYTAQSTTGR
ncbi:phosphatase PAP2 family protein [Streptomyces mutabilis]|uniref:phosphatase PAP2 family protein n=1 Tax=Streptomyces mutabilis TaxID=67332 RepID=UPI00198B77A4|nr:phosphatase PAP2 family protein [Streptomyces mutabilis]GGQ29869.1 inositol phosphorylceramide synthase [Streptomyces mutabilis]